MKLQLSTDGTTEYTLSGSTDVLAGEWVHVSASRSGSTVKLFLNEAEDASDTYASSLHSGSAAVRIGADASGNHFDGLIDEVRLSSADKSATLGQTTTDYLYNARNQLTSETCGSSVKTYSYDKNGNVTKIEEKVGAVTIATEEMYYDELNRMTKYDGPRGTEAFQYRGAEWHRFSQTALGETKRFLYDGDNVVADKVGSSVDAFYVTPFLDQNLSITTGGSTYYYSHDGLGSVRTLSNSSGALKNTYDYLPFGKQFGPGTSVTVHQRHAYTGREENPASPFIFYRYRPYDPANGRMLNRNLWGYVQGRLSLYDAMMNRPTMYHEPFSRTGASPTGYPPGREGEGTVVSIINDSFASPNAADDFDTMSIMTTFGEGGIVGISAFTNKATGARFDVLRFLTSKDVECSQKARVWYGLALRGNYGGEIVQNFLHVDLGFGDEIHLPYIASSIGWEVGGEWLAEGDLPGGFGYGAGLSGTASTGASPSWASASMYLEWTGTYKKSKATIGVETAAFAIGGADDPEVNLQFGSGVNVTGYGRFEFDNGSSLSLFYESNHNGAGYPNAGFAWQTGVSF